MHPALSTDSAAHFDLGVDLLATPGEITEMADPWLGAPGSAPLGGLDTPARMPADYGATAEMSTWVGRLQLPGLGD